MRRTREDQTLNRSSGGMILSNDLLIRNGSVMDGTGKQAFRADVIVEGDRILDVGNFPEAECRTTIDAAGQVVAPGFIDAHTHLDFFLPSPRHAEVLKSWAYQGVTTIVADNWGWRPGRKSHSQKSNNKKGEANVHE